MNYLLILLTTFVFYGPSLKYGFSQDDFFFLKLAQIHHLKDVLLFFSPFHQQGFPFYRPLGTQFYFFVFKSLFGLTGAPFFMHLFMLLLQAFNGYLVFHLFTKLKFDKTKSLLAGIFYSISAIHFLSLFYIAATQHLLATTFSLLALLAFLDNKTKKVLLFLTLGLLSKENTLFVIFPFILLYFFTYDLNKKNFYLLIKKLVLPILLFLFYLFIRIFAGIVVQNDYRMVFDNRILNTMRFYISFLFGFFEKIQDYPLANIKQYFIDTKTWGVIVVSTAILEGLVLFISVINNFAKKTKQILIASLLILLPILPYLGLPSHIFPHYLEFSLLGFILLVFVLLSNKIWLSFFSVVFLLNNFASIQTSIKLHWSPLRANLNKVYIPYLIKSKKICNFHEVALVGDTRLIKELYYSLSDNNGPQVLCNNPQLKVYYQGLNFNGSAPKGAKLIYLKPEILKHE